MADKSDETTSSVIFQPKAVVAAPKSKCDFDNGLAAN